MLFKFLWGKTHKIKKSVVIASSINGGLNMIDIITKHHALKTSWIPKLLNEESSLAEILNLYLAKMSITINLLLKMNFRKVEDFWIFSTVPPFYQQVIISYNLCTTIRPINKLNTVEILSQPLWGNEYLKSKGKCLYNKNWLESGFLFVKDIVENDGSFLSEHNLLQKLRVKTNWMSEVFILKNIIVKNALRHCDTAVCRFTQITLYKKLTLWTKTKIFNLDEINCKEMYIVLLAKKTERPYSEHMWQRKLQTEMNKNDWEQVYLTNFKTLRYKKFSEFKYKILLNILPCGEKLETWGKSASTKCTFCGESEDICHLLYSCPRVKHVWCILSNCLKLNVTLKHIIPGIRCQNYLSENRNICVVIVSYAIFSTWSKCNWNNSDYKSVDIVSIIKERLSFYGEVFDSILANSNQRKNMKSMIKCMLFHLL